MLQSPWTMTVGEHSAYASAPLINVLPFVRHGVTTRHGDLNLSFRTEPDHRRVLQNRVYACEAFGCGLGDLVLPEQTHGDGVALVTRSDRGRGAAEYACAIPGVDALVTNEPGTFLGITIADCLPVFLVDTAIRAIGLAHSGWRGTAGEIASRTLRLMTDAFGTQPSNVVAAIGPGIQADCYEVDDRVRDAFPQERRNAFRASRAGHWFVDLRAAVVDQLVECGVPHEAIGVNPDCTHCRRDLYFSHRGEGAGAGRMGAFIGIPLGAS
jgi:polyphenol oxidase